MNGWADKKKCVMNWPRIGKNMAYKDFSQLCLWLYIGPRNYMDSQSLFKYLGRIDATLQPEFEKEMDPMLHYIESVSIGIEDNLNTTVRKTNMVALHNEVNANNKAHRKSYRIIIYHIRKVDF
jgi:hypothetical protein